MNLSDLIDGKNELQRKIEELMAKKDEYRPCPYCKPFDYCILHRKS